MAVKITRLGVCNFLVYLHRINTSHLEKKVLDCGAGGRYPPLALFYERGYKPYGIDISDEQVEHARTFCREHSMELNIMKGDMRYIPFDDESFSFVYECESMCHLTKEDMEKAITEMIRVLKRSGYLSVESMGLDSWPLDGEERAPGEFWSSYKGEEYVHSYFEDGEPEQYFTGVDIVWKQKRVLLRHHAVTEMSKKDWMNWYDDTWTQYSRKEWTTLYDERVVRFCSSTTQYIVQKL